MESSKGRVFLEDCKNFITKYNYFEEYTNSFSSNLSFLFLLTIFLFLKKLSPLFKSVYLVVSDKLIHILNMDRLNILKFWPKLKHIHLIFENAKLSFSPKKCKSKMTIESTYRMRLRMPASVRIQNYRFNN